MLYEVRMGKRGKEWTDSFSYGEKNYCGPTYIEALEVFHKHYEAMKTKNDFRLGIVGFAGDVRNFIALIIPKWNTDIMKIVVRSYDAPKGDIFVYREDSQGLGLYRCMTNSDPVLVEPLKANCITKYQSSIYGNAAIILSDSEVRYPGLGDHFLFQCYPEIEWDLYSKDEYDSACLISDRIARAFDRIPNSLKKSAYTLNLAIQVIESEWTDDPKERAVYQAMDWRVELCGGGYTMKSYGPKEVRAYATVLANTQIGYHRSN